jgi:hypothetical protein
MSPSCLAINILSLSIFYYDCGEKDLVGGWQHCQRPYIFSLSVHLLAPKKIWLVAGNTVSILSGNVIGK